MSKEDNSCKGCRHADEYFGDCCHPKGGGCLDLSILKFCNFDNGHALWEASMTTEELLKDMERQRNK